MHGHPETWREVRMFLSIEERLNDDWFAKTTVRVFRVTQWAVRSRRARFVKPCARFAYRFWIQMVLGSDLDPWLEVGRGVRFAHGGRQVTIHRRACVGARATIYHGVTIGVAGGTPPKPVPVIGADVTLGTGCAVLGGVTVGDGAAIGANVVVTEDVPACANVISAPAMILPRPVSVRDERMSNLGRPVQSRS